MSRMAGYDVLGEPAGRDRGLRTSGRCAMAWFYAANKRQISHNFTKGGMIRPLHGLVLHIEEGTEAGTRAWFNMTVAERQAAFDAAWEKGGQKGKKLKAYGSSA